MKDQKQTFLIGYEATTTEGLLSGQYLTRAITAYEALKDFAMGQ